MQRTHGWMLSVRVVALAALLVAAGGTHDLFAQKSKGGAVYALHVLGLPSGFASARAESINDQHEIVGTARVSISGGTFRAVYWAHAEAAPVLLPCPAEPCQSSATAINAAGVIAGTANGDAILWHPSGSGWFVEVLPHPGPPDGSWTAVASDVLDDGMAAGYYAATYGIMYPNDVPVLWGALQTATELPVPSGFFSGRLARANASGDAIGELRTNDGSDPTYVYGGLWINDGGTYVMVSLTSLVTGITPRAADESFLISSSAGRVRIWPSGGSWNYLIETYPGGPGTAINASGDMSGILPKKSSLGGTPYLLTADGALVKLPLPSGSSGATAAVSSDRWVAGVLYLRTERPAAVWRPLN